ncbi:MAG TPA: hypothetical protein VHD63_27350 [Ktedonobacteraceae bacterium]|nr:hypothetical protein [Ktedonobacteraceae bacterium]
MPEELFNRPQAVQQAIATTITCRTLIKYNSNLNAEQKAEILNEIETTLAFLGNCQQTVANTERNPALDPEKLADLLIYDEMGSAEIPAELLPGTPQEEQTCSLNHLYRLYRAYFSQTPGKGLAELETRYRTMMDTLDQLQALAELRHDATASDLTIDGLLSRIRGFVTALYCMFREFATLLARIVDGQSIDIDTEAMAFAQEYPPDMAPAAVHDITPLVQVYNRQRQLQQRRGSLYESTRDATAFLIFLQECLEQGFTRRQEIVAQIKNTASLLNELLMLLTDYELAIVHIMQSPSRSR